MSAAVEQSDQLAHLHKQVAASLPHYGFDAAARIELISISENATYVVDDPQRGRAILRLHRHGYHNREQIASELAWTAALRNEAGVRTPAVIPTLDGEPMVTLSDTPLADERHLVMFEWAEGETPAEEHLGRWAPRLGELTARLHEHAAHWAAPPWFSRHAWNIETIAGPLARWGSWHGHPGLDDEGRALLGRAVVTVRRRLARLTPDPDRWGLVHADLHILNLLVDGDELVVIDFDDCGHGWLLWDLAGFFRGGIAPPSDVDAIIAAWFDGYRAVRAIEPHLEAELPSLMLLCQIQGLGWLTNRPQTEIALQLGPQVADGVCELAERYLATTT